MCSEWRNTPQYPHVCTWHRSSVDLALPNHSATYTNCNNVKSDREWEGSRHQAPPHTLHNTLNKETNKLTTNRIRNYVPGANKQTNQKEAHVSYVK